MKHKLIKIIIFAIFIVILSSKVFSLNMTTIGLDKSLMATYLAEDESQNDDIKRVCNEFYATFINDKMSDFEMEMQIIKYLVETVEYDKDEINNTSPDIGDSFKAYGALVNHRAVCSGYAKAFVLLANKCNLSTIVVTGRGFHNNMVENHAWNQIYLDGDWYNVDVTWEDPVTNIKLGFNNLLNEYINRTDAEFSKDHERDNGYTCTATKYGKNTVAYYLITGKVDTNANLDTLRHSLISQIKVAYEKANTTELNFLIDKLVMMNAKFSDDSNYFPDNNDEKINNYVKGRLSLGDKVVVIVTGPNTAKNIAIDSGHWLNDNIDGNVNISMQVFFHSNGENDTRVLIFGDGR